MGVRFEKRYSVVMVGFALTCAGLVCVPLAGCSRGLGASAQGTVSLDGKPVSTGSVTFLPKQSGVPGYASIKADGSYVITTNGKSELAPGEYNITVVAREPATVPSPGDMPLPGKAIVPERYAAPETSGLSRTVNSGPNRIDLELKTTP